MNSKKLKDNFKKGLKSPLYIFTGEEREIMKKYMIEMDANYRIVKTLAEVIPLMNSKTILKKALTLVVKDDKDALKFDAAELLKAVGHNTLILIYPSLDKGSKLGKTGDSYLYEFEKPKNANFYVQQLIPVNDSQAKKIADRCGNDIRRIELEVEKLQILKEGGHNITPTLIDELIVPLPKNRIWDFVDRVVAKSDKGIWEMLRDLKELGQGEVQLAGALYTSYRQLFLVQSYKGLTDKEVMDKTGLLIWQVKKSRNLMGGATCEQLIKDMRLISVYDNDVKFGKVDQELGFKNLIVELVY